MIIVGLILVIAGAAFGIDVAVKNRFTVRDVEAFGSTLGLHHAEQIFILGAITGAVVLLGLGLMIAGISRNRSKHVAHRRQRQDVLEKDQRAAELDAENQRLRQAADEHPRTPNGGGENVQRSEAQEDQVSPGLGGSTALDREI